MKKIVFIALLALNSPSDATESYNSEHLSPQSNLEKLEDAREQMENIRTIFKLTPQKIKDTTIELQRLETSGAEIESTINKYLLVLKSCESNMLPDSVKKACSQYDRTDYGVVLEKDKKRILSLLKKAREKLKKLKEEKEGFPVLHIIIKSLESNIAVLERSIGV